MKETWRKVRLLQWLWGGDYEKTLGTVLRPEFKKHLLGVMETAKTVFPFVNQEYFKGYKKLKEDTINLWGVEVQETTLPQNLLGVFLPKGKKSRPLILINESKGPLYYLTTLAHETSHIPACRYFQTEHLHDDGKIPVRNRTAMFVEALTDREEICADILTAFGAYPRSDFIRRFAKHRFGWKSFLLALFHLPRHYPELIKGFFKGRDLLLNFALLIHFLKLRYYVYYQYGL